MGNLGKLAILVIGVLVLIGGLVWFANQNNNSQNDIENIVPSPTSSQVEASNPWTDFKYIRPVDWPPTVNTQSGPFTCNEVGTPEERAGKTERRSIDGREYCITEVVEGAAGSVYTQYAFSTRGGDNTLEIATFSIQEVQCGNYSEPEMTECEREQDAFNIDEVIAPTLRELFNSGL